VPANQNSHAAHDPPRARRANRHANGRHKADELEHLAAEQAAKRLDSKAQRSGRGWSLRCPAHDDGIPSLSISDNSDGGLLVKCHADCAQDDVIAALEASGIAVRAPAKGRSHKPDATGNIASLVGRGWKLVKAYTYTDEHRAVLFENVRLEIHFRGQRYKTFRQRRPVEPSGYVENLDGVRRVPYRLAEVLQAAGQVVHVPEGEKDADRLAALGLCSSHIPNATTTELEAFRGRTVFLHADNDGPGRDKVAAKARALIKIANSVRIVHFADTKQGGDVSDWLDAGHTAEELLQRCEEGADPSAAPLNWPETKKNGAPVARSQRNIEAFLLHRGVELRHNKFSIRDEVLQAGKVRQLDDDLLRNLRMDADALGLQPSREYFDDAVLNFCRRNTYHPVCDYLDGLKWDGVERLATWLHTYAGAPDTAFNRAIGQATLVAAVRRVRVPGSKFDNLLTLEGPQYAGKSTLARVLVGPEWFSDSLQIGSDPKQTIEDTAGKWVCELAELAGLKPKGRERVKAFLSRGTDRAALKYERLAKDVPRQFICIATVNEGEYLDDPTGNRRFWPVRCGRIDIPALQGDRDQLWAEAALLEAQAASTELPTEVLGHASDEQRKRVTCHPWRDMIEPILEDEDGEARLGAVAKSDLWEFLGIEPHRNDPVKGKQLTDVMISLGYESARLRRRPNACPKGQGTLTPCFVKRGWSGAMPWIRVPTSKSSRYS